MKTTIVLLTALTMTMTSFKTVRENDAKGHEAAQRMALQLVTALQRSSVHEYSALFPSAKDFHQIMDENASLYGANLEEAKLEFQKRFETETLPSLKQSFSNIITEGKKAGIDWRTIQFTGVEFMREPEENFDSLPLTITFTSKEKGYRLHFEKILIIDGTWKVTPKMTLV